MDHTRVERISKALADETRLRIFEAISLRPNLTCGEIVSMRGVTPATISHHLKVLQDAELIECRRAGPFVHSRTVAATVAAYASALQRLAAHKPTAKTPRRRR